MKFSVTADQIDRIVFAYHHDPFDVLGAHLTGLDGQPLVSVRACLPEAEQAWVVAAGAAPEPMTRKEGTAFFEAQFPGRDRIFPYELRIRDKSGQDVQGLDPYSFLPIISAEQHQLNQ